MLDIVGPREIPGGRDVTDIACPQIMGRVLGIVCRECGAAVKVIACIEDPVATKKDIHSPEGKSRSSGYVARGACPPQKKLLA